MRTELRAIQQRVGITFIYITHDQGEALTMSDRIAVMSQGVIQQIGDGAAVYDNPTTAFVASFVGENNAFYGTVKRADGSYATVETRFGPLRGRNTQQLREGDKAVLFVRPQALSLANGAADAENVVQSAVTRSEFEGQLVHIYFKGDRHRDISLSVTNDGRRPDFEDGQMAEIAFSPDRAVVLPPGEIASE
jgi:spermidine/putrescine transport system ATP-binding protein